MIEPLATCCVSTRHLLQIVTAGADQPRSVLRKRPRVIEVVVGGRSASRGQLGR